MVELMLEGMECSLCSLMFDLALLAEPEQPPFFQVPATGLSISETLSNYT